MLIFIGTGLSLKHLTLEAIEYLSRVDKVIIDTYTNIVPDMDEAILSTLLRGKEIVYAKRSDLEGESIKRIVQEAKHRDIAILVPGDPFIATTHDALRVEAYKNNVKTVLVNGLSIYSLAASRTGLQAYRFGKTVTLVYPDPSPPYSVVETIYENIARNLHTLVLLDLRVEEKRAMSIPEAVDLLRSIDDKGLIMKYIGVAVARAGSRDEVIVADRVGELREYSYPKPPHCLIVVAKPHPVELDNLRYIGGLPAHLYEKYLHSRMYP